MRDDSEDGDKERDGDRDHNGDKKKDRDQNGDRDTCTGIRKRSTMKPSWLRLKLKDQVGIATCMVIIIVILTAHACLFFFLPPNVCIQTAGPSLTCGLGSDCCTINPTNEHRTQLWHA